MTPQEVAVDPPHPFAVIKALAFAMAARRPRVVAHPDAIDSSAEDAPQKALPS